MTDLDKYRDTLYREQSAVLDRLSRQMFTDDDGEIVGAMPGGHASVAFLVTVDALTPVVARIIADAKAEVAAAIESLHYDAPAAKTAQATAARIARGVQ